MADDARQRNDGEPIKNKVLTAETEPRSTYQAQATYKGSNGLGRLRITVTDRESGVVRVIELRGPEIVALREFLNDILREQRAA